MRSSTARRKESIQGNEGATTYDPNMNYGTDSGQYNN